FRSHRRDPVSKLAFVVLLEVIEGLPLCSKIFCRRSLAAHRFGICKSWKAAFDQIERVAIPAFQLTTDDFLILSAGAFLVYITKPKRAGSVSKQNVLSLYDGY